MNDQTNTPTGIRLIALFYLIGAAALLLSMFFNYSEMARQMAVMHGLPAEWKLALPVAAVLGLAIAYGLYSRSRWGYVLTIVYLLYLGITSYPLSVPDGNQPFLGNFLWSLFVVLYLGWKWRTFFPRENG
ncbi:MAG: hypothetical protein JXA97_01800 [Anaerolineales bacterium]|nr:hypothetical protein [Anaerolineales bacterium]